VNAVRIDGALRVETKLLRNVKKTSSLTALRGLARVNLRRKRGEKARTGTEGGDYLRKSRTCGKTITRGTSSLHWRRDRGFNASSAVRRKSQTNTTRASKKLKEVFSR